MKLPEEPPRDYADGDNVIVELVPKLLVWAILLLQAIGVSLGGYGLNKLGVIAEQVSEMKGRYDADINSLNQRVGAMEGRVDRLVDRENRSGR